MKNNKVHQSVVCHKVPSRLSRTNRSFPILAFIAVFAGCLLSANLAVAQPTLNLRYTFDDVSTGTTTPSDTSGGGVGVTLQMMGKNGSPSNLHGAANSGVNGLATGNRALNLSTNTSHGSSGAFAAITNSALGFGNVSSFVVTMWMKETLGMSGNTLGRMFLLGNSTNSDVGTANSIGMKWQSANLLYFYVNNVQCSATIPAGHTNGWIFVAMVYNGTNVYIYEGTDISSSTLLSTTATAGQIVPLSSAASLFLGNKPDRSRDFVGFVDDFRFYTGTGASAAFVEGIRQELAPLPSITGVYPDGTKLLQGTNALTFNVSSTITNITNVSVVLNGVDVSSQLLYVTNGTVGTSTNLSVSYTNLLQNKTANTVVITVATANGTGNTYSGQFDTYSPTNFVWEAEEFDFNSGQYIDNPAYTSYTTNTSYFGLDSVEAVDTHKGSSAGSSSTDYRAGSGDGTRTQTAAVPDTQRQKFLDAIAAGDASVVDHNVGNWSSGEWQNYTKTFPAGKYNVYGRLSCGVSATLTLDHVTSGQGTSTQTTTNLGTFTVTGTSFSTYQWIPLRDGVGNLATIDLSGVKTVRVTTGGGGNANFYMLVPANTNLPSISGVYPNGQALFQSTNKLVFTVSSDVSTISTNSITLTLNGTNVTPSLVFAGSPTSWNVSYTGLLPNQTYTAVINVTDANGSSVSSTLKLDTWNPVFQVEAEDFDFSSGQYIDNPAPTTDPAANSYFGQVGTEGIDEHTAVPHNGASASNYRATDLTATTLLTAAEPARQQFLDAGAPDYNVGFLGPFFWQNYTKTWPTGTFNVYARVASGAGSPATIHLGFDRVTGGWGTTAQFTKPVGGFTIPTSGGYSAYLYVPLIDQFGNYANVTLGGTNTFRTTFARSLGTRYPGESGLNINFYMLVAARTDLPRIDGVYPNNLVAMQSTNKLAFVASSPNGINTTNIHMTLNGVDVSTNLVFTGSSTSWSVSYPGLLPGKAYTAVITITDANNQTRTITVNFSTAFNPADYTWEAEDYDFDPAQSPIPNGSGLRYIDNPALTSVPASNSYVGQEGDGGQLIAPIDYAAIFGTGVPVAATHIYRPLDFIATEVTSDVLRQKYYDAQQLNGDPTIADYDVFDWATNGWVNYTRTFPAGQFYLYGRISAASAFNLQCAQVTNGWGTVTQASQYLGAFRGTNTSFANWQWVPLVNTNNGNPVVLTLGGTNTFQMTGDYKEDVNFFQLVPLPQSVSLTASVSGTNIVLSFPTQAGSTYTIYYKNNLTDSTWTSLGASVSGDGSIMSVLDGISESHRFYRLMIQ